MSNLLSIIFLMLALTACSSEPPASTKDPTLYPGARNVVRTTEKRLDPVQIITFQTNDSPQAVFYFYARELEKDGWELNDHLSTPTERNFGWVIPGPELGQAFSLTIYIERVDADGTDVKLSLINTRPR
jgi:hypothetical protein